MPIQVQAPDGNIAQFPDGMADADIERVMADHYPQPSVLDRAVASPVGRFAHDAILQPVEGLANIALGDGMSSLTQPVERAYEGSLARNRNTPGYAKARSQADAVQAQRGSGFNDQVVAPFLPSLAGTMGLPGGFDAMNANADAQAAAQQGYAKEHPVLSFGANVLGGFLAGPDASVVPLPKMRGAPAIKPMAKEATDAGYVLPPRMVTDKPGLTADVLAGWGGKVKTAQAASAKNQEVTNALAAKSLGLPPNTPITDKVLSGVRKQASQSYKAIPQTIPSTGIDAKFASEIQALGTKNSAAGAAFPDLMGNEQIDNLVEGLAGQNAPKTFPTNAAMDLVRQLRNKAKANFKAQGDPEKLDLAFAQRGAADALDGLIERNLAATGNPQLAAEYRAARVQIAKAHDVEAATNTATGNVSARKLAAMSQRGKPFTGELETIADTASAFPRATQSESAFGEVEPISILDVAAGAAALPHNPSLLGAIIGRPAARGAVLSGPVQRRIVSKAQMPRVPMFQLPSQAPLSIPYGLGLPLLQQGQ